MTAVNRGYLRPVGDWNFIEVTAVGPKLKMELNGTLVTETDLSEVQEYMAKHPHLLRPQRPGGVQECADQGAEKLNSKCYLSTPRFRSFHRARPMLIKARSARP